MEGEGKQAAVRDQWAESRVRAHHDSYVTSARCLTVKIQLLLVLCNTL